MISAILVPMDGSEMSEHALEFALGAFPDAEITVLHVVGEPTFLLGEATRLALADDLEGAAKEQATEVFARAQELANEHERHLSTDYALGHPARAIVAHAEDYDLVVIGSHGRDLRSHLLLGDIAQKVSRRSPVPVTIVR